MRDSIQQLYKSTWSKVHLRSPRQNIRGVWVAVAFQTICGVSAVMETSVSFIVMSLGRKVQRFQYLWNQSDRFEFFMRLERVSLEPLGLYPLQVVHGGAISSAKLHGRHDIRPTLTVRPAVGWAVVRVRHNTEHAALLGLWKLNVQICVLLHLDRDYVQPPSQGGRVSQESCNISATTGW